MSRYATAVDDNAEFSYNEHYMKLWSAHLGNREGWIWVCYSSENFNVKGEPVCGSWDAAELWKDEKTDEGIWEVVHIK